MLRPLVRIRKSLCRVDLRLDVGLLLGSARVMDRRKGPRTSDTTKQSKGVAGAGVWPRRRLGVGRGSGLDWPCVVRRGMPANLRRIQIQRVSQAPLPPSPNGPTPIHKEKYVSCIYVWEPDSSLRRSGVWLGIFGRVRRQARKRVIHPSPPASGPPPRPKPRRPELAAPSVMHSNG